MICPHCGFEISEGMLYCEKCGEEIHIVPDFDPELETRISENLTGFLDELEAEQEILEEEVEEIPEQSVRERRFTPSSLGDSRGRSPDCRIGNYDRDSSLPDDLSGLSGKACQCSSEQK